jgi:hypothetical protein
MGAHVIRGDGIQMHRRSFQHFNTRVGVVVDRCDIEAAAAAAVAAASFAYFTIQLVLEPKYRQRF